MARTETKASSLLLRIQSHRNRHMLRKTVQSLLKLGGTFLYSYTCTHYFVCGSPLEVGSIPLSRLIQMPRWMISYRHQEETKSWLLIRMRHSRKESNHSASLKWLTVLSVAVGGYRVRAQRTLGHGLKCRSIKERNTRAFLLFTPTQERTAEDSMGMKDSWGQHQKCCHPEGWIRASQVQDHRRQASETTSQNK